MKASSYKGLIIIPIVLVMLILYVQCKRTPVEPKPDEETNCNYEPGNRNFTWQIDTVAWWPSEVGGVWAFSDNDAYIMGNINQWENGKLKSYLGLHWNGSKWSTDLNGTVDEIKHYSVDVVGDNQYMVSVGDLGPGSNTCGLAEFNNNTKKWKGFQFQTEGTLYSVWTDQKGYFIAGGTNGMIYQKDGYDAEWIYIKAPTDYTFTRVTGITKNEIYLFSDINLVSGYSYQQVWKYSDKNWIKLLDNQDTTGTSIKIPNSADKIYDLAVTRCNITDSLSLLITGKGLYEFYAKGESLSFSNIQNFSSDNSFGYIKLFSPTDYWLTGLRYNIYHWNGEDLHKIEPLPILSYGQLWGIIKPITKSSSGKIWMILETDSQVYSILQGIP